MLYRHHQHAEGTTQHPAAPTAKEMSIPPEISATGQPTDQITLAALLLSREAKLRALRLLGEAMQRNWPNAAKAIRNRSSPLFFRRYPRIDGVVSVIAYLLLNEAAMINGVDLPIDGGFLINGIAPSLKGDVMKVKALVLEKLRELSLREIDLPLDVGPDDVKIRIDTVGVCGSDVHYYTHGRIGDFVVNAPMVLGHEAAGTVVEIGPRVKSLKIGDRVCMEPGVPDLSSRASKLGIYNVDPAVVFWATPPVHGVLTPYVVHPAVFTFKLPDNVSFAEGAMVEPFAVGLQASSKAQIKPGDTAVVTGAGPIGVMTALAALASGCSRVIVSDIVDDKLAIAGRYAGISTVNVEVSSLVEAVMSATDGWGADVVFEASGSPRAYEGIQALVRPGGCLVAIGMPVEPVKLDISSFAAKEIRIETVFRYANVFDRALTMIASGKVHLMPLISETFTFDQSIAAFERAAEGRPKDVKLQIKL